MMKKLMILVAVTLWFCAFGAQVTFAQLSGGLIFPGPGTAHSTGGGGGCSNTLDFSVACNSQYISVL